MLRVALLMAVPALVWFLAAEASAAEKPPKLDPALVAWYSFEEMKDGKVVDRSGQGLDLTVVGTVATAEGKLRLSPGETTSFFEGAEGAWRRTTQGWDMELRLPYRALGCAAWPVSGDLGFSLIWIDRDNGTGTDCQLYWAEDGQYWSPRWYGVVRKWDGSEAALQALPWRVRWR